MPSSSGCQKWGFSLAKGKIASMTATIHRARVRALAKIGLVGERIVTKHIQAQDLDWEPLAEEYVAWKEKMGYSTKTYVMTASYFQAIISWIKSLDLVYIGTKKGVRTKDGGLYEEVAGVLESRRPLWGPSLIELRSRVPGIVGGVLKTTPGIERI